MCHKSYITLWLFLYTFHTGVGSLKVYARGEKRCSDEGGPNEESVGKTISQSAPEPRSTFLGTTLISLVPVSLPGRRKKERGRGREKSTIPNPPPFFPFSLSPAGSPWAWDSSWGLTNQETARAFRFTCRRSPENRFGSFATNCSAQQFVARMLPYSFLC